MSTRGRKPTPTHLKLIAGNPGRRPIKGGEPKPPIEEILPPLHIRGESLAEWKRLAPMLVRLKLMTSLDRAAFAIYCIAWARYKEAEEQIAMASALGLTHNGYPIVNPWCTIQNQAVMQMARFMTEFGLTPGSRARMAIGDPQPDGNADSFQF